VKEVNVGTKRATKTRILLVASDERDPKIERRTGKRFLVNAVSIVDTNLRKVAGEAAGVFRPKPKRPPRLCGSRSTCVAIVELPSEGGPA
jgi:hypothetical protein